MITPEDLRNKGIKPDAQWAEKYDGRIQTPKQKTSSISITPISELESNERKYGWRISNGEAQKIEKLISQFPTELQYDLRHNAVAALKLATHLNIPFEQAFDNIDFYQNQMYPEIKDVETFRETIDSAANLAAISREIVKLTHEFRKLSPQEQQQNAAEYKKSLLELQKKQAEYTDKVPANKAFKAIGETVQSLLLMREGLAASTIAGLAAAGGLGLINPAAGLIGGAVIGAGTGFAINREMYSDLVYADMYQAGIEEPEILEKHANMTGNVQALIEMVLGMLPLGSVSGGALRLLSSKVIGRFIAKGAAITAVEKLSASAIVRGSVFRQMGINLAAKPIEGLLEGTEEALQSVAFNTNLEKAATEAAEYRKLMQENLEEELVQVRNDPAYRGVDWGNVYRSLEDIGESFEAGIAMALVMGVPVTFVGTVSGTVSEVKERMANVESIIQTTGSGEQAVKQAVEEVIKVIPEVSPKTVKAFVENEFTKRSDTEAKQLEEKAMQVREQGNALPEDVNFSNLDVFFEEVDDHNEAVFFDMEKFTLSDGQEHFSQKDSVRIAYDVDHETGEFAINNEKVPVTLTPELVQALANKLAEHEAMPVKTQWEGKEYTAEPPQIPESENVVTETLPTTGMQLEDGQVQDIANPVQEDTTAVETTKNKKLNEIKALLETLLPMDEELNIKVDQNIPEGKKGSFSLANKIIKVKNADDVESVIHEALHQFALTLTADDIRSWAELANTVQDLPNPTQQTHNFDLTTREGMEQFTDRALQFIHEKTQEQAENRPERLKKVLQKIRDFVVGLWDALTRIGKNSKKIDAWFEKVLGRDERHTYNQELITALDTNLRNEIAKSITYSGSRHLVYNFAQSAAILKSTKSQLIIEVDSIGTMKPIGSMKTGDFISLLVGNNLGAEQLFEVFSESSEQEQIVERIVRILGMWAAGRPFITQIESDLRIGSRDVIPNETIIGIIKPLVEARKIRTVDSTFTPELYAPDPNRLDEVDFWNQPDVKNIAQVIESQWQDYVFDAAYNAIETYGEGKPKEALKYFLQAMNELTEYSENTDSEFSEYSGSVYRNLFLAIYRHFPELSKIRNSVGNLTEEFPSFSKKTASDFQNEVNEGRFFRNIFKSWQEEEAFEELGAREGQNSQEEKQQLQQEKERLQRKEDLLKINKQQVQEATQSLREEENPLEEDGKRLQKEMKDLQKEIQTSQEKIQSLQKKRQGLQKRGQQLQTKKQQVQKRGRPSGKEERLHRLQEQIDSLQVEIQNSQEAEVFLLEEIGSLQKKIEPLQKEIKNSQEEIQRLQQERQRLQQEKLRLKEEEEFLQKRRQQLRTEKYHVQKGEQRSRALKSIIGRKTSLMQRALDMYKKEGNFESDPHIEYELKKRILKPHKGNLNFYKNLYGVVTGDDTWVNPESREEMIERMRSRGGFAPDELKRIEEQADFETILDLLSSKKGLPTIAQFQRADATIQRKLETAKKKMEKIPAKVQEWEEYRNLQKEVVDFYRQSTQHARLTANRDALKNLKKQVIMYAEDTVQYQAFLKKIAINAPEQNLQDIISTIIDIEKIRGEEKAVEDLKRYLDKAFHTILKKPPKDILLRDKKILEDLRTVLGGNKLLANYLGNLYAERFHVDVMIDDYIRNADFRASIDSVLDITQKSRLNEILEIKYDTEGKPTAFKKWADLTNKDKNNLGHIFALQPIQQERMDMLIREIQNNPTLLEGVYSIMSFEEEKQIKRYLFDKKGKAKDPSKMKERTKTWLVRRITGRPEWSEKLDIQEPDPTFIEEAAERIQESDRFTEKEKEVIEMLSEAEKSVFKNIEDVSLIAAAVSRTIKSSREEWAAVQEAKRIQWSEAARNLAKSVPQYIPGRPYSSLKKFKGDKGDEKPNTAYKKGDIVTFNGNFYEAKEDTKAPITNENMWKELWSPDKPDSRGTFQKVADWWHRWLDPTRMAQLHFQEGGLPLGEGEAYREIIRSRNHARNIFDENKNRRTANLIKELKDKKIEDKEWTLHSFKAGDFEETFNLAQVMYFWAAAQNDYAREAVQGGVFLSPNERDIYNTMGIKKKEELQKKSESRYLAMLKAYDEFKAKEENKKYHEVLLYIIDELQKNFEPLKEFMEKEYNVELTEEAFYIPIRRLDIGTEEQSYEEQVREMANPAARYGLGKGFTIERNKISLGQQTPLNYNLFDVYLHSINQTEKLTAYTPWVRKMRFLFEGKTTESRYLQQKLKSAFGDEGLNFWHVVLRDEINNGAYQTDKLYDKLIWFMRGSWVRGSVLGRISSLVTQGITSMPASLTEVSPVYLTKGLQVLKIENKKRQILRSMLELSPYMADRWRLDDLEKAGEDMIGIDDYKLGKAKGIKPLNRKINRKAAKGFSEIDLLSVAPIFHGVYLSEMNKSIEKAGGAIQMDGKNPYIVTGDSKTAKQAQANAIERAELTIRMTQPDTDLFNKPLFLRNKSGGNSFLSTFQSPFVTLFNHWTWDIPQRLKRDFKKNIAMAVWGGFMLASSMVLMGFLRDEDKEKLQGDPEDVIRRLTAYLLGTQGVFGNTPIVGMMLGALVESIITGENFRYIGTQQFPQYGRITRMLSGDEKELVFNAVSILLWMNGTFAGQVDDIRAAIEKVEKEDNNWWYLLRGALGIR
jgi:hypothetical protein